MASIRRQEALANFPPLQGFDRDEWPMAITKQGGIGADIKYISPSDNRGAGAYLRWMLQNYSDGTWWQIKLTP